MSAPCSYARTTPERAPEASRASTAATVSRTTDTSSAPSVSAACFPVISPAAGSCAEKSWSRSDSASRIEPCACRPTSVERAVGRLHLLGLGDLAQPGDDLAQRDELDVVPLSRARESVAGIFCGSVVASRNLMCPGGSSSVLSSALKAAPREHVHFVDDVDLVAVARRQVLGRLAQLRARRRRRCCEAASISCTSTSVPAAMSTQGPQTPHGSGVGPSSQLSARARIRAEVVLPTRGGR